MFISVSYPQVCLSVSVFCLLISEGMIHCSKTLSKGQAAWHEICKGQRRSVQRLRNIWLLLAQLCWLLLTELPLQIPSSTIACQLCGALTHLLWMLFWFTSGAKYIELIWVQSRCGRYLSDFGDEKRDSRDSSLPSSFCWPFDSTHHGLLWSWFLLDKRREHLFDKLWRGWKIIAPFCFLRRHDHWPPCAGSDRIT